MKDFNGTELNIGDRIIFIAQDSNAHNLRRGIIDRFDNNIGITCVIKTSGGYEYKIRNTNKKVVKS